MKITELLVTGYDEGGAVVAVNLVSGGASVVLMTTDDNGETVVRSAWQQATDAFTATCDLLDNLLCAPAATSSGACS